jgi:hypothetical protein
MLARDPDLLKEMRAAPIATFSAASNRLLDSTCDSAEAGERPKMPLVSASGGRLCEDPPVLSLTRGGQAF